MKKCGYVLVLLLPLSLRLHCAVLEVRDRRHFSKPSIISVLGAFTEVISIKTGRFELFCVSLISLSTVTFSA